MKVRIPMDQYFYHDPFFFSQRQGVSYDHGSLNRRPGALCVIGELYALRSTVP